MNRITKSSLIMILLTFGFMTFFIIVVTVFRKNFVRKWTISDFRRRGYTVYGSGDLTLVNLSIPSRRLMSRFPSLFEFLVARK